MADAGANFSAGNLGLSDSGDIGLQIADVAVRLGLPGEADARYCPACQSRSTSSQPSLIINGADFECYRCGARGVRRDLVKLALRCENSKADEWLDRAIAHPLRKTNAPELYELFMDACRPLPDRVTTLLEPWGIKPEVALDMRLRYYTRRYGSLMRSITSRFGIDTINDAGLLDLTTSPAAGAFQKYHDHKVPYLVIPYLHAGKVVYLRIKPLVDPSELDELGLPRMMSTAAIPPSPFNAQCVEDADHVLIFRWELDAMTAASLGLAAVAAPDPQTLTSGFLYKLKGKKVSLILDSPKADDRAREILRKFKKRDLAEPETHYVIPGEHLRDCLISSLNLNMPEESDRPERPERPARFLAMGDSDTVRDPNHSQAGPSPVLADASVDTSFGIDPGRTNVPFSSGDTNFRAAHDSMMIELHKSGDTTDANDATDVRPSVGTPPPQALVGPDQLITVIDCSPKAKITVHRQSVGDRTFVRCRYWTRPDATSKWTNENRLNFIVSLEYVKPLILALQAAERGDSLLSPSAVAGAEPAGEPPLEVSD